MADPNNVIDVEATLSSPSAKSQTIAMAFDLAEAAQRAAAQALSAAASAGAARVRVESVLLEVQQAQDAIETMIANGGLEGAKGDPGDSAYQIALINGFSGSEVDWLNSLKGATGATGQSTYQLWLSQGNTGTSADFLASLKGAKGDPGTDGVNGTSATIAIGSVTSGDTPSVANVGTPQAAVLSFVLQRGEPGAAGAPGTAATVSLGTVQSGTEAAATMTGTPQARVLNLTLPKGDKGNPGDPGRTGDRGPVGPGVPVGGAPGQILAKLSTSNYETQWIDAPTGSGTGTDTELRAALTNGTANTVKSGAVSYQLPDAGAQISLTTALNDVFTAGRPLKTPADALAFYNALRAAVPASSGDNTRTLFRDRNLKMNFGPGRFKFTSDLLIDFDSLEMYGSGMGVTELQFDNASKLQIGVDADTNAGIRNVKSMTLRDLTVSAIGGVAPQLTPGMVDGVVSIRMLTWSEVKNLYVKNTSPLAESGGIYLSGYQWVNFTNVNSETFGRYALMLDSQSPETWEVLAKFTNCQFVLGNSPVGGISACVYVYQSGRFRNSNFSALGVSFNNAHLALYPSDGNHSEQTRAFYVDPAISGVDLAFAFEGNCLIENVKNMFECAKDATVSMKDIFFYGNGQTQQIIMPDAYQCKWDVENFHAVNCAEGFMQLGNIVIRGGANKITGIGANPIRMSGNTRITGKIQGFEYETHKSYTQSTSGAPVAGATSWTVTGLGLSAPIRKADIKTSWLTEIAFNLTNATNDGFTVTFSTPVPATFVITLLARATLY